MSMKASELAEILLRDPDHEVLVGKGPGVLRSVTSTVNGFTMLDGSPARPGEPDYDRIVGSTILK